MELPSIWNPIEVQVGEKSTKNYLFGLLVNSDDQSYKFTITDLSTNFWIESVNKTKLLTKLEDNGIDIIQKSKIAEFLQLLQRLVNKREGIQLKEIKDDDDDDDDSVPSLLTMRLSQEKLRWSFTLSRQQDVEKIDILMKFQLFNSINVHYKINQQLRKVISKKDRIIQTLLENFLELNNSYNSSLEDDNADFTTRVENNKPLERIFPSSSTLRKSLLKFDFNKVYEKLEVDENIWQSIENSLNDHMVWQLSNRCSTAPRTKEETIPNQIQQRNSDFVNYDDLEPTQSSAINRSLSPKRRKIIYDEEDHVDHNKSKGDEIELMDKTGKDEEGEEKHAGSLSHAKKKFGVIRVGVATPSKKRKLKASTNSPIKAPRLI